jgi:conjugative relaxase-like TrwC/TraI family protein
MLDLSKPLTAGKIKEYFKDEYGAAENAYFSQGGTIRGEWHGELVNTFGLNGPVEGEAFNRLAEGQHPLSGEQLIKHKDTIKTQSGEELGHRAGWDFTFKPGKSVSVTALVGEDDRVRVAHRRAVSAALDALEAYVQARMSAVGPPEATGKWIAAKFEHDTARPVNGYPAPQLHTHVIVFNMTEDSQGFAHSLQPYELFRVQSMATAVYQNVLEHDLRMLGYQMERGKNHAPEIKGYTAEYLESESQRSALIRQALEAKGLRGAEAASIAAHADREEKLKLSPSELKKLHQTHAVEFGNQPSQVVAEAAQRQPREHSVDKVMAKATAAVAFARERLSERSQVLEHFEIARDALRYVQGRASLQDVEAAISVNRTEGKLQEIDHIRPFAPAHRYTTPEAVAAEREIIDRVRAGQGESQASGSVTPGAVNARFSSLNEDQRALIVSVLQSRDQISGIQGRAGTGKTTAMAAIRELAEENGYKAIGLGPTSKATKGLKEAGMEAENLAAYLARGGAASEDARPRLFFVDEASLTSTNSVRDFLRTVRPQDRVLLIGDTRQHQSIEAGRIFDQLQDAGMQTATLSKIVRQKDEGLRQAVELLAVGKTGDALDLLEDQQRIKAVTHRGQRFESIANEYAASPNGTLVISPDNESRKELNTAIRAAMRNAGHVKEDAFSASILIHRQDVTAADKGRATTYRSGDTLRYRNGSDVFGIAPKSYGTVIAVEHEINQVTVKLDDGKAVSYDPARLRGVSLYTPESRPLAVGDRIQFTAPWKDQAIANRDLATVTYLDQSGNIRASLDDSGRTVGWNLRDYAHVDYAYTMTSHSAQGVTVDRALIHVDTSDSKARALIDQTLAYVAGSRPRYDMQIFTDNAGDLSRALGRQHQNATALSREQTLETLQQSKREPVQHQQTEEPSQFISM